MTYGTINSMKTKPGRRDEVVAILLSGAEGLRAAGCHLYVVGTAADDDVTVWVSEVWESREHHAASLQLPETQEAISAAMPMLAGEFTSQEVRVQGGVGV
ncbi:putative quinol monooxygenase [Streptomonospora nanhaiensis]|uniref:Quinol monooxygenase YgiN n=1 Tax=Streptomonospora nanhaiensis TaxID=1323731 RepID=A0A853BTQ4_9ACTN|nr:putative quinol monooxygenase [Streptomonospora nanhaiensis]MBV2363663.1 antibiotic biosynthesis monooxygenase [Streptomonospora nanhaiensis]MBX9387747.1 antibiotic biosynthesis monooxygenase [Streptomonospora nanhaiensis]NYI98708.1 quinol monooxygenase YgiN [Streptomonospora nanhaiensis]